MKRAQNCGLIRKKNLQFPGGLVGSTAEGLLATGAGEVGRGGYTPSRRVR